MANTSLFAAFERMWQHTVLLLSDKVDKVDGMGLSTNDFNDNYKNFLDENIDSGGVGGTTNSDFVWKVRDNSHYSLMWEGDSE